MILSVLRTGLAFGALAGVGFAVVARGGRVAELGLWFVGWSWG